MNEIRAFGYVQHTEAKAVVEEFAARNGITLIEVAIEAGDGDLASKLEKLGHILVRLHAHEAEAIIIDRLQTLSDDKLDQELLLAHLKGWSKQMLCVAEPDLADQDAERDLIRRYTDKQDLFRKLEAFRLRGSQIAAEGTRGKRVGAKRYGALAGEDAVLQRIRKQVSEGLNPAEIARELNREGVPTRQGEGKRWHATTIRNILDARRNKAARLAKRTPRDE